MSFALQGLGAAARCLVTEPRRRSSQRLKSASNRVDQNATGPADGRGRKADSPAEIPAQGWKDILWRTYHQFNEERLLAIAAGVVFYALLFPAIAASISSYALVAAKTSMTTLECFKAFHGGHVLSGTRSGSARAGQEGRSQTGDGFFIQFCAGSVERPMAEPRR